MTERERSLSVDGSETAATRSGRRRLLWVSITRGDSYVLVLGLLVLMYLATSLLPSTGWAKIVIVTLDALILLATLRTSRVRRPYMRVATIAGGLAIMATTAAVLVNSVSGTTRFVGTVIFLLLLAAPSSIGHRILTHRKVTYETLAGAVDIYLLVGLIFAAFYKLIEVWGGTPFFAQVTQPTTNQYLYFSFVTLTTLGYGDLSPATDFGRTVVVIEAILGQVYLVTAVARLVSLVGSQD